VYLLDIWINCKKSALRPVVARVQFIQLLIQLAYFGLDKTKNWINVKRFHKKNGNSKRKKDAPKGTF
jgi:hypothetical protein